MNQQSHPFGSESQRPDLHLVTEFDALQAEADQYVKSVGAQVDREQAVVRKFMSSTETEQDKALQLLKNRRVELSKEISSASGEAMENVESLTNELTKLDSLLDELENSVAKATASWAKKAN